MEKNINDDSIEYVLRFPFLFTQKEKQKLSKMIAKREFSFEVIEYLEDTLAKRGYDELVEILKEQYTINSAFEKLKNRLWDMDHLYQIDGVYDKLISLIEDYRGTVISESKADYLIISAKKYFDTLKGWDTFKVKIEATLIENIRKYVNIPEEIIAGLDKGGVYGLARLLNYSKKQLDTKCKSEWIELLKELEEKGILLDAKKSIIGNIERNFETISDWGLIYLNIVLFHLSSNEVIQLDVPYKTFRGRFSQSIWCLSALKEITSTREVYILIGKLYGLVDSFMKFFPLSDDDKKLFDELKKQEVKPQALVMLAMKYLKNVQEKDAIEIQLANDFTRAQDYCANLEVAINVFRCFVEKKRKEQIEESTFHEIDQCYGKESYERTFLKNILNEYVKGNCSQEEAMERYKTFTSFLNCKDSLFMCPFLVSAVEKEEIEYLLSTKNEDGNTDKVIMEIIKDCFIRIICNPLYKKYNFSQDKKGIKEVQKDLNNIEQSFNGFLSKYESSYLLPQDVISIQEAFESSKQEGKLAKTFLHKFKHVISKRFRSTPKTDEFIRVENSLMNGDVFALKDYIDYINREILPKTANDLITAANIFFRVSGQKYVIDSKANISEENIIGLASRLKEFCKNNSAYSKIQSSLETIDPSSPYVYSMQLLTDLFYEVSEIIIDPDAQKWYSILDELFDVGLITIDMWKNYSLDYVDYLYDKAKFDDVILPILTTLNTMFACPVLGSISDSTSFENNINELISELQEIVDSAYRRINQYIALAKKMMPSSDIQACYEDIVQLAAIDILNRNEKPVEISEFMITRIHPYSQSATAGYNITPDTEYLVYNYNKKEILRSLDELKQLLPKCTNNIIDLKNSLVENSAENNQRNKFASAFIALDCKVAKIFENADEQVRQIYQKNRYLVSHHEKFGLERYLNFVVNYLTLEHFKNQSSNYGIMFYRIVLDLICAMDSFSDEKMTIDKIREYVEHLTKGKEKGELTLDVVREYLRIMYHQKDLFIIPQLRLFIPEDDTESKEIVKGLQERMEVMLGLCHFEDKTDIDIANELINLLDDTISKYNLNHNAKVIAICIFEFIKDDLRAYSEESTEFIKLDNHVQEFMNKNSLEPKHSLKRLEQEA